MAIKTKSNRWMVRGIKHPEHRQLTVRVGEYRKGGPLHVFWWEGGRQRSESLQYRVVDLKGKSTEKRVREVETLGASFIAGLALRAITPKAAPTARLSCARTSWSIGTVSVRPPVT